MLFESAVFVMAIIAELKSETRSPFIFYIRGKNENLSGVVGKFEKKFTKFSQSNSKNAFCLIKYPPIFQVAGVKFLAFGHIFALFASISSAIAATATRRRLSRIRPPQWSANSSFPSVMTFWQAHHPPCEVGQVSCKRRLVPFLTSDLSPLARWSGSQAGQTSLEDMRKTCSFFVTSPNIRGRYTIVAHSRVFHKISHITIF